ncbi:acyl-CoA dehydrogenase family protein [Mesorhizobium sp. M0772]|uniref:acyl-CoA dehydrogenase family protein n=1 Tax=Mesorhizobium sp. M0772 TaxID=2956998 RepID=UPI00333D139A
MQVASDALGLTVSDRDIHAAACAFAECAVAPHGAAIARDDEMAPEVIGELQRAGLFGMNLSDAQGGLALGPIAIGLYHEALGQASSAVRSILTVHGMVCEALNRWGSAEQRARWCVSLAHGDAIAAFALTEDGAGSDVTAIGAAAVDGGSYYRLTGRKLWVTGGQLAKVFLVLAKCEGEDVALLVERDTPGLDVEPVSAMLGLRGAMLGNLNFRDCAVPRSQRIGATGLTVGGVIATALDFGRYTVAWGAVGIGRACLEQSMDYAETRSQGGKLLRDHQLVSALLADMIVGVRAASLLCLHAGRLRETKDPQALWETAAAKYFAASMAAAVASSAVQIFGARGCSSDHPAQRHYRDAKILEIIEGSTQIQQQLVTRLRYASL